MAHDPERCKEVFAMLSEYLDLALPPDACQEIERHLEGCAPCEEFLESLRKTVEVCRGYQPGTAAPPLTPEARARLEKAWQQMLDRRGGRTA